jgi:UDP-N-acetylmuramoyl-tripeptide--D-alanyl-D-alanine ligase
MAPPQIGVVLNVGTAHVGEFGSREAIAVAKAELVEALPAEGVAVLNADDDAVRAMADRTRARVVLVGEAPDAHVRAEDVVLDERGRARFRLVTPRGDADVALDLVGRHHVANSLAVAAVALEAGLAPASIATALAAARPISRWRMEVTERADGVTVVNDAYNANPDSMRAALDAVAAMSAGRRAWAVLGSMLELGPDSDAEHAGVGEAAVDHGIEQLLVVGELARPMALAASERRAGPVAGCVGRAGGIPDSHGTVRWVADAAEAQTVLAAELRPGDVVLFKSSRDAGLRWLGESVAEADVEGEA